MSTSVETRPLTEEEKKKFSPKIVGMAVCPFCHQDDVKVMNEFGRNGDSDFNYLESHSPKPQPPGRGGWDDCDGSDKLIHEL